MTDTRINPDYLNETIALHLLRELMIHANIMPRLMPEWRGVPGEGDGQKPIWVVSDGERWIGSGHTPSHAVCNAIIGLQMRLCICSEPGCRTNVTVCDRTRDKDFVGICNPCAREQAERTESK